MKQIILLVIINFGLLFPTLAQDISELQFIEGKWYMELTNKKGYKIASLKIVRYGTNDTAKVKQSVIDILNKPNALIMITVDSLLKPLAINPNDDYLKMIINDTIVSIGLRLIKCVPQDGYSNITLDYSDLHDNYNLEHHMSYYGLSIPSLGKFNKKEDAFAIIKGKLYTINGELYKNTTFMVTNGWQVDTGKDTLKTDAEGNFSFATWPINYGNGMQCGLGPHMLFVDIFDTLGNKKHEFYTCANCSYYPGINNIDVRDSGRTSVPIVLPITLSCAPNPSKGTLTVSYSLVKELSYGECMLQIRNTQGQPLQTVALENAEGSQVIELDKTVSNGTYFCSLVSKGVVYKTVQFMVQR